MVIYIAGPFRASTPWGVHCNVANAEIAALEIAKRGHVPMVPHCMYRNFDKALPDEFWLAATITLLERCDAILMLPGWERSQGAIAEHQRATDCGMRVFYEMITVPGGNL
jgi:hypothetical protein